jgi:hypothetical protein
MRREHPRRIAVTPRNARGRQLHVVISVPDLDIAVEWITILQIIRAGGTHIEEILTRRIILS